MLVILLILLFLYLLKSSSEHSKNVQHGITNKSFIQNFSVCLKGRLDDNTIQNCSHYAISKADKCILENINSDCILVR